MTKSHYGKKIIIGEVVGFLTIILFLWADEIFDLPHLFFSGVATPINWLEAALESIIVLILAFVVIAYTCQALRHVKILKRLLPICASCKKIRDDQGYWQQVEIYLRDHSEVNFSHCICPECAKKLYPEYDLYES